MDTGQDKVDSSVDTTAPEKEIEEIKSSKLSPMLILQIVTIAALMTCLIKFTRDMFSAEINNN